MSDCPDFYISEIRGDRFIGVLYPPIILLVSFPSALPKEMYLFCRESIIADQQILVTCVYIMT